MVALEGLLVLLGAYWTLAGLALLCLAVPWCLWVMLMGVRGPESYMDE